MMPLQGHPGALPAAQAYLCVPPDKREAAADYLYVAPDDALTPSGVLTLAGMLDLDRGALGTCAASKDTEAALARDKDLYQALGARGLPLTLIGRRVVIGNDPDRIEQAIEQELAGETLSLRLEWLFAALAVIFAGAAFSTWRAKAEKDIAPEPSPS
jgi:protein-disulfide isomerase